MSTQAESWVPKVHPATRAVEVDDPMELMAEPVDGDPDLMFQCVVQEFAWVGMGRQELLALFRDPNYPVLNQLLASLGPDEVNRRVSAILGDGSVIRVQETIAEVPEPDEDEPELIQLRVRRR